MSNYRMTNNICTVKATIFTLFSAETLPCQRQTDFEPDALFELYTWSAADEIDTNNSWNNLRSSVSSHHAAAGIKRNRPEMSGSITPSHVQNTFRKGMGESAMSGRRSFSVIKNYGIDLANSNKPSILVC